MQLKRKRPRQFRRQLLTASCALLGVSQQALADKGDVKLESALSYYSEDGGIKSIEPTLLGSYDLGNDSTFSLTGVADSLTGATPTGALPSSKAVTVTGPSGKQQNTVAAGAEPKNTHYKDTRLSGTGTWSQALTDEWRLDIGGHVSNEHDFTSLGANLLVARDFNEHNTTVSGGVSYEYDNVNPIGGVPLPLATVPAGATVPIESSRRKAVKDVLVGVSQVMSHDWVVELNLSYSIYSGYLNDPYKVVSLAATTPTAQYAVGDPVSNIYENRPGTRYQRAVYLRNKVYLGGDVVDFSYRYGIDDWGVRSNTFELRYQWNINESYYLQPHLRYYTQTAAYFYRRGLLDSEPLPNYVSADYRLAGLSARTVGIEFGKNLGSGDGKPPRILSFRVEHYSQGGGSDPRIDVGVQRNFDLFPGLSANIVEVNYAIDF